MIIRRKIKINNDIFVFFHKLKNVMICINHVVKVKTRDQFDQVVSNKHNQGPINLGQYNINNHFGGSSLCPF